MEFESPNVPLTDCGSHIEHWDWITKELNISVTCAENLAKLDSVWRSLESPLEILRKNKSFAAQDSDPQKRDTWTTGENIQDLMTTAVGRSTPKIMGSDEGDEEQEQCSLNWIAVLRGLRNGIFEKHSSQDGTSVWKGLLDGWKIELSEKEKFWLDSLKEAGIPSVKDALKESKATRKRLEETGKIVRVLRDMAASVERRVIKGMEERLRFTEDFQNHRRSEYAVGSAEETVFISDNLEDEAGDGADSAQNDNNLNGRGTCESEAMEICNSSCPSPPRSPTIPSNQQGDTREIPNAPAPATSNNSSVTEPAPRGSTSPPALRLRGSRNKRHAKSRFHRRPRGPSRLPEEKERGRAFLEEQRGKGFTMKQIVRLWREEFGFERSESFISKFKGNKEKEKGENKGRVGATSPDTPAVIGFRVNTGPPTPTIRQLSSPAAEESNRESNIATYHIPHGLPPIPETP